MRTLSLKATREFMNILQRMGDHSLCRFDVQQLQPLYVQQLDEAVTTPWGVASLYRMAQTYRQQGDTMYDPEMTFLLLDHRNRPDDMTMVFIYAISYRQDGLGLHRESVRIRNRRMSDDYYPKLQQQQSVFAGQWLSSLRQHGLFSCPMVGL